MKMAPVLRELKARPEAFDATLVHTGQHFDAVMSDVSSSSWASARPTSAWR
jgi:UDP-N-acetylglucosamine 2-epimerase